jgi:hypothetical protein
MVSQCHTGKCPAGIATTDWQHIQDKYKGKPEHVARMLIDVATAVSKRLDQYGFDNPSEAVGRVDLLKVKEKSPLVGLERLLTRANSPSWVSPSMKWDDHTSHVCTLPNHNILDRRRGIATHKYWRKGHCSRCVQ